MCELSWLWWLVYPNRNDHFLRHSNYSREVENEITFRLHLVVRCLHSVQEYRLSNVAIIYWVRSHCSWYLPTRHRNVAKYWDQYLEILGQSDLARSRKGVTVSCSSYLMCPRSILAIVVTSLAQNTMSLVVYIPWKMLLLAHMLLCSSNLAVTSWISQMLWVYSSRSRTG